MTTITIDGLNEEEFRRSIERRLRHGEAVDAVERLRGLLEAYAGSDRILPERFLKVSSRDLTLNGWDSLADSLRRHDRPGRPVTALSIALAWPGEDLPQPDSQGHLNPHVEVGYFTDDAYPFSKSGRDDLLDGYSYHGCTWADDCEATDRALWLGGVDDLHGALAALEARLLASEEPDPEEICAGSLGACLLSVLLHQAVAERIERDGLPRPLCVMAGSNGVYPYFDAPVAGLPEHARRAEDEDDAALDAGVPGPRYSSLLVTGIRRAQKRAVLVLEETEEESAVRIAKLRGQSHVDSPPAEERQADTVITATPASPLMVKKPSGHNWDFRDMLGPRDPDAPPPDGAMPEPEWDQPESDRDEPVAGEEPPEPVAHGPENGWTEAADEPPAPIAAEPESLPLDQASEPSPSEAEPAMPEPELARIWPDPVADEASEPAPGEPEPITASAIPETPWSQPEAPDSWVETLWPEPELAHGASEPVAAEAEAEAEAEAAMDLTGFAELPEVALDPLEPANPRETEFAEPARQPSPAPGFSLFDPQERLQSLLALHLPARGEEPESDQDEPAEPLSPVWARGLAWRERTMPAPPPPAWLAKPGPDEACQPARAGLWAQIRGWWLGQR